MSTAFPLDAKVRFTQQRLAVLTPRDRQGLEGRIGVIQTDSNLVRKPTVYFPEDGSKQELRLFRVDPRQLELVEAPTSAESPALLNEENKHTDLGHEAQAISPTTPDGNGSLSQSDMDNFFD